MLRSTAIKIVQTDALIRATREANRDNQQSQTQRLEFEKEKLQKELDTKDRADVSLKDYQKLLKELDDVKSLNNAYKRFINELGQALKYSPEVLLKAKNIEVKKSINPMKLACDIIVKFEIDEWEVK